MVDVNRFTYSEQNFVLWCKCDKKSTKSNWTKTGISLKFIKKIFLADQKRCHKIFV